MRRERKNKGREGVRGEETGVREGEKERMEGTGELEKERG